MRIGGMGDAGIPADLQTPSGDNFLLIVAAFLVGYLLVPRKKVKVRETQ